MRVIIMGCGRVGEQLARLMSEEGHDVAVIDYDASCAGAAGAGLQGPPRQRRWGSIGMCCCAPESKKPTALRR